MLKPRYIFAYKTGTIYKDSLNRKVLTEQESREVDLTDFKLGSVEYLDKNNNIIRM